MEYITRYKIWESAYILVRVRVLVNDYFGICRKNTESYASVSMIVAEGKSNKTDRFFCSSVAFRHEKTGND